jgi:putative tryptophan/tyrosine transport system substrate-binding protein
MRRREATILLGVVCLRYTPLRLFVLIGVFVAGMLVPQISDAQQHETTPRIGYLSVPSGSCKPKPFLDPFGKGLGEHGYIVDKNVVLDCRDFDPERGDLLREIVRDLVRENVDVMVTPGTQVTLAVKQETNSIPIVMLAVGDPVGVALVASLARPGGNITGLSNMLSDVAGKRLEILKEIAPGVSRVAVLFNPAGAVRDCVGICVTQSPVRVTLSNQAATSSG